MYFYPENDYYVIGKEGESETKKIASVVAGIRMRDR